MPRATPPESVSSDEFASDNESPSGVGMSDPRMNSQVRRMLDAMNRLYNTGCVSSNPAALAADVLTLWLLAVCRST